MIFVGLFLLVIAAALNACKSGAMRDYERRHPDADDDSFGLGVGAGWFLGKFL